MYSPVQFIGGIQYTMNKSKNKSKQVKTPAKQKSKKTPFADVGQVVGRAAGNLLGAPQLAGVGKWLGSGIGSIFGSGDYTMCGPKPSYNILQGQVPQFSSTHATNIVSHREYLGDVAGTTAFANNTYPLNPGMAKTFPWLSTVAVNYQQYNFHGLIFEYRPLLTDYVTSGSPGVVCLTTNYNAIETAYTTRQEAENAEFAVSTKPTQGLLHMIECSPTETQFNIHNIRAGAISGDLRSYDYGLTQFITQNNPSGNLGELWVSYTVEFFKPILSFENNYVSAASMHLSRSACTGPSPFGTINVGGYGTISFIPATDRFTMTNLIVGTYYELLVIWTAATSVNIAAYVTSGMTPVNLLNLDTNSVANVGAGTASQSVNLFFVANNTTAVFQITSSTITGACAVDAFVNSLDPTVTA